MPSRRTIATFAAALGLILLGLAVGILSSKQYAGSSPPIEGLLWPNPKQIQSFSMVDEQGHDFDLADLNGKWSLLFFGYTHCPDICPLTLAVMNEVQSKLAPDAVQIVFVTVDPERDTPARMGEYVRYFSPLFRGLGGSTAQVQSLTGQLGIPFYHGALDAGGNYLVDHSASLFVTDPQARLVAILSAPHRADAVLERFLRIRDFVERAES